jgi:hypothetical protein
VRSPRALIRKITMYGGIPVASGGLWVGLSTLAAHRPDTSFIALGAAFVGIAAIVQGVAQIADSRNRHLPEIIEATGQAEERIIDAQRRARSSLNREHLAAAALNSGTTPEAVRVLAALKLTEISERDLSKPEIRALLTALTNLGQPDLPRLEGPDDQSSGELRRIG